MSLLSTTRVLVIGGSSGIGLAIAQLAAAEGALVTVASRSRDRLDAAVRAIGHAAVAAELDTGDETAVVRFFADREPFDHIVISAAQTPSGPVRGLSLDDARRAMESKFWGAYRVAHAARMVEGGSLTFVSASSACAPRPAPCSKAPSTPRSKRWRVVSRSNWHRCGSTRSRPG